jgi:hypothetical protein
MKKKAVTTIVAAVAFLAPAAAHGAATDIAGTGIACSTPVVAPGGSFTCKVGYQNLGPEPIVPADLFHVVTFDVGYSEVTAVSSPNGICSMGGANPHCDYQTIPVNGTVEMTATFRAKDLADGFDEDVIFEAIESEDVNPNNNRLTAVVQIREPVVLDTSLSKNYKKLTAKKAKKAKWALTSTIPGSSFECKVDKKKWKPCASPVKAKKLKKLKKPGKHKLCARAIAPDGTVDATPACDKFKVKKPLKKTRR